MSNYKCLVTDKNGHRKMLRVTRSIMAHIIAKFREFQQSVFNDIVLCQVFDDLVIVLNNVKEFLFIDERPGERLEIA